MRYTLRDVLRYTLLRSTLRRCPGALLICIYLNASL